jgi:Apea-like HEPN
MTSTSSDPYIALTPLYAFSSDTEELNIGEVFRLVRYTPDSALPLPPDDILTKHLRLYAPDYLLWQRAPVDGTVLREVLNPTQFAGEDRATKLEATLSVLFHFPTTNLLRLLRLFKPGRVIAGDTFVVACETRSSEGLWETTFGKRCSEMLIDYGQLRAGSGSYTLLSGEVPFFDLFRKALLPQLESLQKSVYDSALPPLEIALQLYNQDEIHESRAVLNALTALEALLTNESNAELSYRLSLRVANLLESDDASRLNRFKEMKEFYDLRSKIIHGSASKLSPKLQNRIENVESLREILRRTILSVMAITANSGTSDIRLDEILDQIVFDEVKRTEIQRSAAKFLHVEGFSSYRIQ